MTRCTHVLILATAPYLVLMAAASRATPQEYTIRSVDVVLSDSDMFFASVNTLSDAGQVGGSSGGGGPEWGAFLWDDGTITRLETPSAYQGGEVFGINNEGAAAGSVNQTHGGTHAVLWQDGMMTDLGTLGGVVSRATDLNDLGQVVGTAEAAMGIRYAFIWHEGVMTDLNDPERLLPPSSTALSINNSGQIVGFFVDTGGGRQAVLWNAGEVTELGTLGGRESEAVDINESGQVVGWAHTAAGGPRAFLWADGKMIELGTLRGRTSYASAINNAGVVVGRAAEAGGYPTRAFVHDSANGMRDLNDLTTLGSGWILYRAFDINDAGQILVSARCGCRSEAFVLTPTTADLGGQWANDLSACPHRTCGHLTARPPTPGTGPCGIGTVGLAPLMVICVGTMRSSEVRRQT